MPDSPKNALPAGQVVGQYRIEHVLGAGGFGIVYRGRHQELGLDVAIKEYLPPEIAVREGTEVHPLSSQSRGNYDEGLRRFLEEAKRLVQFNHSNVVRCRDFFRANGTAYLVMDYEDGLPLSELLRRREEQGKPLDEDEIKQIILPLLDGLAVIHKHDVLHRDIKPSNIFVRKSTEEPVLIDFGTAKQGFSEHSKSVWAYTQGYAPMEQIEKDGKLGPWTDIYAVGAVMWRIVSGENPPRAEDRMSAKARGKPDPMKPATEIGKSRFSAELLQAIDKCLPLEEKDRHQSAKDLGQALRKARQSPLQQEQGDASTKATDSPPIPHKSSGRKAQPGVKQSLGQKDSHDYNLPLAFANENGLAGLGWASWAIVIMALVAIIEMGEAGLGDTFFLFLSIPVVFVYICVMAALDEREKRVGTGGPGLGFFLGVVACCLTLMLLAISDFSVMMWAIWAALGIVLVVDLIRRTSSTILWRAALLCFFC